MNYEEAFKNLKSDFEELKEEKDKFGSMFNDELVLGWINYIINHMEMYEKQVDCDSEELIDEDMEFKGWDYSELLSKFNLDDTELSRKDDPHYASIAIEEPMYRQRLVNFLQDNFRNELVVKEVRRYVKRISEYGGDYAKVWKAMTEIESDLVFMQFVFALIFHMWT